MVINTGYVIRGHYFCYDTTRTTCAICGIFTGVCGANSTNTTCWLNFNPIHI